MAENSDHFLFSGVVVCDDIREEVSGKHLLIGVYSNGMTVDAFPIKLRLYIYVLFRWRGGGSEEIQFRTLIDGQPQKPFATGQLESAEDNLWDYSQGIPVRTPVFDLEKPAMISFEAKIRAGEWASLGKLSVDLQEQ